MLPGINIRLRSKGYQQLAVDNVTPVSLTVPDVKNVGPVVYALIVVETAPIRYRDDGINPASGTGMLIQAGMFLEIAEDSLRSVRFVAESSAATLDITYYG